ncbi:MAG: Signal peptidase-like protein [Candidatus Saccharicenans subterraneus]|uniref:Signal peptidase-like protein n=1 Tax=Candidatus Saccharicenans subterraneus TaxID=2508984 RepID=A0A3E2BN63_9BACT|nr:MAG: Signal peptidase-like protein [Candidatus Saccharicenans subterraneum]
MTEAVLLLSESTGKIIRALRGEEPLEVGDYCLVESEYGGDLAMVIDLDSELARCPKAARRAVKIIRKATEEDIKKFNWLRDREKKAFEFCLSRIKARNLPMKLVAVRYFFNEKKGIFYYTADGRIDFRQLVKDLAKELRMRIEMRQIGVRDEAKLVGGLGVCGRPLCCFSFIKNFEPITIQKARKQQIVINPTKISGLCGRLMCCLAFEEESKGRLYIEELGSDLIED